MPGSNGRWLLQRIALLDSPLLMIAAVVCIVKGWTLPAIALALLAFGCYTLGRPAIGQRHPPT